MRKRLLLIGAASVGLGCVVMLVLAMLPPRPGVTKANFDRIEIGMTQAEVESIVWPGANAKRSFRNRVRYDGDTGSILIIFEDDKVADKDWAKGLPAPLIERIFRWLGLR